MVGTTFVSLLSHMSFRAIYNILNIFPFCNRLRKSYDIMHPLFQILHVRFIVMPGSRRPLPIVGQQRLRATSCQTTGKKDSL